jgi:peptide/nickel transport system ATP-binding protein/oligopeptide transport system ATP-binding protein
MAEPLLAVRDLAVDFRTIHGTVQAVRGVSFEVAAGESVALVGESGSGKSVTGRALLGLVAEGATMSGTVRFDGQELTGLSERELNKVRGTGIGMVFQDALDSLNPVYTVRSQLAEVLRVRLGLPAGQARAEAVRVMEQVGIPDAARRADDYPHEFSGGMRQRVCIGLAVALRPRLLIADEPTTALDVTVQASILRLLGELRDQLGMSLIFVTHDLAVARLIADQVLVMLDGRIVERGPIEQVFADPRHRYTRALLEAHPGRATSWRDLRPIPEDFVRDRPSGPTDSSQGVDHGD